MSGARGHGAIHASSFSAAASPKGRTNVKFTTRSLTRAAIIAALYLLFTFVFQAIRVCFQKHKTERKQKKYAVRRLKPKGK